MKAASILRKSFSPPTFSPHLPLSFLLLPLFFLLFFFSGKGGEGRGKGPISFPSIIFVLIDKANASFPLSPASFTTTWGKGKEMGFALVKGKIEEHGPKEPFPPSIPGHLRTYFWRVSPFPLSPLEITRHVSGDRLTHSSPLPCAIC